MDKLSVCSFVCGQWQILANCISLIRKPITEQKWWSCNYSLSFSVSQPKQESQSSLFVMDVAQLKEKGKKKTLLCEGFLWRAAWLDLKFFGFHIAASLMKREIQKLFLLVLSQLSAQLDGDARHELKTHCYSQASVPRLIQGEQLECPAAFPAPIPLCLIFLYSGTVSLNKVCIGSKGIKHEQVPQCWKQCETFTDYTTCCLNHDWRPKLLDLQPCFPL